jgi:protein O-GlcNAc transferase
LKKTEPKAVVLEKLKTLHSNGHFDQALCYIQNLHPTTTNDVDIIYAYIVTLFRLKRFSTIYEWALKKNHPSVLLARSYTLIGLACRRIGISEDAEKYYLWGTKLDSKNQDAFYNLGNLYRSRNEHQKAINSYKLALNLKPSSTATLNNLALSYEAMGDLETAFNHLEQCKSNPEATWEALFNWARMATKLGRLFEAEPALKALITDHPDHGGVLVNYALLLDKKGLIEDCIITLERAVKLDQNNLEAHYNLAEILIRTRRYSDAFGHLKEVIVQRPTWAEAHCNAGVCQYHLGNLEIATEYLKNAYQLSNGNVTPGKALAKVLKETGSWADAIHLYDSLLKKNLYHDNLLGEALFTSAECFDWADYEERVVKLEEAIVSGKSVSTPFTCLALIDSPSIQRRSAAIYADKLSLSENKITNQEKLRRNRGDKIRIAYLSSDFYEHPTAHLIMDVLATHDRSRFELTLVSLTKTKEDEYTREFEALADSFIKLDTLALEKALSLLRELQFDIAVDLKGYTKYAWPELILSRFAKLHISYLGYPGTMGHKAVDYIIADRYLIRPEDEQHYTEKVLRLPGYYQANRCLTTESVERLKHSSHEASQSKNFIFCSFNNSWKLTPHMFRLWMEILSLVPKSELWILTNNDYSKEQLKQNEKKYSLFNSRLRLFTRMPRSEYLNTLSKANLFLDTFPYNAHTTASDAASVGLPILTMEGKTMASRVAASMLRTLGFDSLITNRPEQYSLRAVELAKSSDNYNRLREQFSRAVLTSEIFDPKPFTVGLERLYLTSLEATS